MPKVPSFTSKSTGSVYERVMQWNGYYIGLKGISPDHKGKCTMYRVRIEAYNKTASKLLPTLQAKLPFGDIKEGDHLSCEVTTADVPKAIARCLLRIAEVTQ